MFKKIVKHFGPEWGAAVMGTAAISITIQLSSEVAHPFSVFLYIGIGFYLLTTVIVLGVPGTLEALVVLVEHVLCFPRSPGYAP